MQSDPWAIHRPDTPRDSFGGADEHVNLIICSGLNIVIDPRAAWRPLREQDVDQLADALNRSDWSASHRLDFRWWRLQHSQVPPPRAQPVPHDQAASGRDYRRAGSQPTRFPSKRCCRLRCRAATGRPPPTCWCIWTSSSAFRRYEEVGLALPTARSQGGFRLYTDDDIARLLVIKRMKPLDFTLEEMRGLLIIPDQLQSADTDEATRTDLTKRLTAYRSLVEERCRKIRARISDAEQFTAELAIELRRHRH
ncbi:MerR family transcriptional regulator [Actinomadura sp. NPDC048955]|uniref:MerR family transcriptional regulator n=1 Tax=Actinomadura sp. NPDC048955 TaxID=3158228 RepID=UPI0033FF85A6